MNNVTNSIVLYHTRSEMGIVGEVDEVGDNFFDTNFNAKTQKDESLLTHSYYGPTVIL